MHLLPKLRVGEGGHSGRTQISLSLKGEKSYNRENRLGVGGGIPSGSMHPAQRILSWWECAQEKADPGTKQRQVGHQDVRLSDFTGTELAPPSSH